MLNKWEEKRKAVAEEMVNTPALTISLTPGDILGIVTLCQCASRDGKAPAIIVEMAQVAAAKIQNSLAPNSLLFQRLEIQWLKGENKIEQEGQ